MNRTLPLAAPFITPVITRFPTRTPMPALRPADLEGDTLTHIGPMRAYALALTLDHAAAENLVADAITDAWQKTGASGPQTDVRTWLFTSLHDRFHAAQPATDDASLNGRFFRHRAACTIATERFCHAFKSLTLHQREALILTAAACLSPAEAASVCGCTIRTLENHAQAGRQRLAAILTIPLACADLRSNPQSQGTSRIRAMFLPAPMI